MNQDSRKNSIQILADMLTDEKITINYDSEKSETVYNPKTKTISLPAWNMKDEELFGLSIHEIGSALYSHPEFLDTMKSRYSKSIVNILESNYVDRRLRSKYNGTKKVLEDGYSSLNDSGFFTAQYTQDGNGFPINNSIVNQLNFIDRANMYFKLGHELNIQFSDEEMDAVRSAMTMTRVNFEDVAQEFTRLAEQEQQSKTDTTGQSQDNQDSQNGQNQDNQEGQNGQNQDNQDNQDNQEGQNGQNQDNQDSQNKKPQNFNGNASDFINSSQENSQQSSTDNSQQNSIQNSTSNSDNTDYTKFESPKLSNLNPDIITAQLMRGKKKVSSSFRKMLKQLEDTANQLAAEFNIKKESKASYMRGEYDSGELDMNKLHAINYDEDIFMNISVEYSGDNYGLVCLIDCSGSMSSYCSSGSLYTAAVKKAITLALFARMVNIPYSIYGFTSLYSNGAQTTFAFLSSDMNLNDKDFIIKCNAMYNMPSSYMGGTPLIRAIFECREYITEFKTKNELDKVTFIVLNDGAPDSIYVGGRMYDDKTGNMLQLKDGSYYSSLPALDFAFDSIKLWFDKENINIINCLIANTNNGARIKRDWDSYVHTLTNEYISYNDETDYTKNNYIEFIATNKSVDKIMIVNESLHPTDHIAIRKTNSLFVTNFIDAFVA